MAKCQLCGAPKGQAELFGCLCCRCDKIRGDAESDRAVEI